MQIAEELPCFYILVLLYVSPGIAAARVTFFQALRISSIYLSPQLHCRLHCRHRLAAHRFSSPGRGGEVSRRKMGWRMAVSRLLHGCVLVLLLAAAVVQAQRAATRTDPTEGEPCFGSDLISE